MKKLLAVFFFIAILLLSGCVNKPNPMPLGEYPITAGPYERITPIGDNSNKGFFDPSVEYQGSTGYLIYSGLEQPADLIEYVDISLIHTHLAKSSDAGKSWTFVARINESIPGVVESEKFAKIYKLSSSTIPGMWHHEVASLLFDPDDTGKEWKLFWHKYFSADMPAGQTRPRIYDHSWIAFKEAASPELLAEAEEVLLFATGEAVTPGRFNFDKFTPVQTFNSAYTEPGTLYFNKKIYVALSHFYDNEHNLILVSSTDHGQTWNFNAIILEKKGRFPGLNNFTGAALAEENGRVYLIVSPVIKDKGYQGAYVFEFEDLDNGTLKRDSQGMPQPVKYFKRSLSGDLMYGQSTYHASNTYGGLIMSQADLDSAPAIGQLFSTNENLTD